MDDYIHRAGDKRGCRNVYLDGKLINHCIYANTKRGIVDVLVLNDQGCIKLHKRGKRPLSKRLRGKVEVVACD
ncbi:hypothetical protein ACLUEY_01310 [Vreelandella aquamarina]